VDGYWRGGAGRGGVVSGDVEQEGGDGDLRWVAWEKVEIMTRSCSLLLLAVILLSSAVSDRVRDRFSTSAPLCDRSREDIAALLPPCELRPET
jgi:hypothetical protein